MIKSQFEKYPLKHVLFRQTLNILVLSMGFYFSWQLSWMLSAMYILYYIFITYWLMQKNCSICYYCGKRCCSGLGLIAVYLKNPHKNYPSIGTLSQNILFSILLVIPILSLFFNMHFNLTQRIIFLVAFLLVTYSSYTYYLKRGCAHCLQSSHCCRMK
jgi:hypothetical protein